MKYLCVMTNYLEVGAYVLALVYALPVGQCEASFKPEVAAFAVFLAWMNLLLYFRRWIYLAQIKNYDIFRIFRTLEHILKMAVSIYLGHLLFSRQLLLTVNSVSNSMECLYFLLAYTNSRTMIFQKIWLVAISIFLNALYCHRICIC